MATKLSDRGLCASFQEPALLAEYAADVFKIGKKRRDLYCCFVSNGCMMQEALRIVAQAGLEAIKIDLKGLPGASRISEGESG